MLRRMRWMAVLLAALVMLTSAVTAFAEILQTAAVIKRIQLDFRLAAARGMLISPHPHWNQRRVLRVIISSTYFIPCATVAA